MPPKKGYKVRREDLTDQEWQHLDQVLFPLLRELRCKANIRLATRKEEESKNADNFKE